MTYIRVPTKAKIPLYKKVTHKQAQSEAQQVQVPIISAKSLILQGLIFASAFAVADAVTETTKKLIKNDDKNISAKYISATLLVGSSYYVASRVLYPEKYGNGVSK